MTIATDARYLLDAPFLFQSLGNPLHIGIGGSEAAYEGKVLITKPPAFVGSRLTLNVDTGATGYPVRIYFRLRGCRLFAFELK